MVKNQAKRKKRERPTSKRYQFYSGKKGKVCPRCGPGIFLAQSKDREYCGRCHWTEFIGKKS